MLDSTIPGPSTAIHDVVLILCQDCKSHYEAAAFVAHILGRQQQQVSAGKDPWVFDTREVLIERLKLGSERQLKNVIAFLKDDLGVLKSERHLIAYKGSAVTVGHYLINVAKLNRLIENLGSESDNGSCSFRRL